MKLVEKYPILVYLIMFILLLSVALNINYWQNDEWVYYPNITQFLNGNLKLDPYIAATFYSTGLLASGFAYLFGSSKIPVLTLLVSISSIYVIFLILRKRTGVGGLDSFLLSILIMVNPLFIFTTWGFMTDNYFLFFMLLSIYFISNNNIIQSKLGQNGALCLMAGNIMAVIAYFSRQLGLIIPLSLTIWLLINRRYKLASLQLLFFLTLALYHFFLFPKSTESLETKFVFSNLTYFQYVFSLGVVLITYLAMFLFPLYLPSSLKKIVRSRKILLVCVFLVTSLTITNLYFKNIGWVGDKLYYLKYTVQRNGFFVENLHGIKTGFPMSNKIYYLIDMVSKIVGIAGIGYIIVYKKFRNLVNLYFIILITYALSLFVVQIVYDRYLIPLFPLILLSTAGVFLNGGVMPRYKRAVLIVFCLIMGFYSYNFSMDYILTNRYVWNKSLAISSQLGVSRSSIVATDAWRYLYPTADTKYKFTYDSPDRQDYATNWRLIEYYDVSYPLRFLNNKVYLYAKSAE